MAINASDLLSTTLPQIDKGLADNIANSNPLLKHLKKNNKIKRIPGGYELTENMLVKQSKNGSWFKGGAYLKTGNNEQMMVAHFDWKNYNINVTVTGEDEMKNSDSEWRIRDLVKDKLNAAESTATNEVSVAMYTNQYVTDPNEKHLQLTPLEEIVSDVNPQPNDKFPTVLKRSFSTLAGITPNPDGVDEDEKGLFWCNYFAAPSNDQLIPTMDKMYMCLCRNNQKPDIIVCSPEAYDKIQFYLFNSQHFIETNATDNRVGDPSFVSIRYKGIPVFFDMNCTANTLYMLNTNYLFFKVHSKRFFTYEPEKKAPAQDVKLFPLYFMGNLTCSGRQFQGRIRVTA